MNTTYHVRYESEHNGDLVAIFIDGNEITRYYAPQIALQYNAIREWRDLFVTIESDTCPTWRKGSFDHTVIGTIDDAGYAVLAAMQEIPALALIGDRDGVRAALQIVADAKCFPEERIDAHYENAMRLYGSETTKASYRQQEVLRDLEFRARALADAAQSLRQAFHDGDTQAVRRTWYDFRDARSLIHAPLASMNDLTSYVLPLIAAE